MRAANCPDLAFAKRPPRRLEKDAQRAALDARDRAERKKCHLRSGMRCEVIFVTHRPEASAVTQKRCKRRVENNHHLISGIGKRNVGDSILAEHRLDTCADCHGRIEDGILEPYRDDEALRAETVRYIEVAR